MNSQEYEGMSRNEALKFKAWLHNEHAALYPPPVLRSANLDWKFKTSIVTSIATVLLAALRTAQMFYAAAELSAQAWGVSSRFVSIVGFGDAFVSMLAVEAGLVVAAAIRSTSSGKVNPDIYKWQIGILLTISIIAGLGQSLGLIKNIDQQVLVIFSYVLSVVLGIGASIAAWFSGEILGYLLNVLEETRKNLLAEFEKETETYQKTSRKFWNEKKAQEKEEERSRKVLEREESSKENSKKVPEGSNEDEETFPDWKTISRGLSDDQWKDMADWTPEKMQALADKTGKTYKTFSNYRKRAREHLGMVDSESNN